MADKKSGVAVKSERHLSLRGVFIFAIIAVAVGCGLQLLGLLKAFDGHAYDRLFSWRQSDISEEIVLLGITDEDIDAFGRWPWPRSGQAEIFQLLAEKHPKAVVFDVLYTEASLNPAEDAALAAALSKTRAIGACSVSDNDTQTPDALRGRSSAPMSADFALGRWLPYNIAYPIPSIAEAIERVGHVEAIPDDDGSMRQALLVVQDDRLLYPSLGLQGALAYLDVDPSDVRVSETSIEFESVEKGSFSIPVNARGRTLIPYPGDISVFQGISVSQLAAGQGPSLEGKVVLIGMMASGHLDRYTSPVAPSYPGLGVHASIVNGLLTRSFIQTLPWFFAALGAFLLSLGVNQTVRIVGPVPGLVVGVLLTILVVLASAYFLARGSWWSPVLPAFCVVLSLVAASSSYVVSVDRHRKTVRAAFGRYLSPQVLDRLLEDPHSINTGARRKDITVFFSDIRGFTSISEELEPEQSVEALGIYLSKMTEIVYRHDGTLDKFIGDAVMVFFNDPIDQSDHVQRALRMSLEMREAMVGVNETLKQRNLPPIKIGMGINTGYATVGNLGSDLFSDYTVIGSTVNLAARIESKTESGDIFVSDHLRQLADSQFDFQDMGEMAFKNVRDPVRVWALLDQG